MKKLCVAGVVIAASAFAAEVLLGTLSGAGTQTLTVAKGAKLALQCTTGVRYRVSAGAASTVTSNDSLVATGDPYRIDIPSWADRLNVAHQDTTTAISCAVYTRDP